MASKYKWFSFENEKDSAQYNFFCFPHAGAGASLYASWGKIIPDDYSYYPVLYPMRENRRNEEVPSTIQELAKNIAEENIDLFKSKPSVFFGHCFGALVAYEVSLILKKENCSPVLIVAASSESPRKSDMEISLKNSSIEKIADLFIDIGYMPESSRNNKIYLDFFMPVLKADYTLVEDYIPDLSEKCECPILAVYGNEDEKTRADEVRKWADFTESSFSEKEYSGGHFFVDKNNLKNIIEDISGILNADC